MSPSANPRLVNVTQILVSHLSKSFDGLCAVDDISLHVDSGEIFGLIGPDGAGKTTTMRLLCGALQPDSSPQSETVINIVGIDMLKQTDSARAQLGYLPQRFSMYEELTVLENLRFFAEVRGLSQELWQPRCMQILEFVSLASFVNRRAGQLSGGMRQKLGLAVALVHSPKVLLLDEPTTGVDPVTRQDFWQLIIRLVEEEGVAILVSTPYMDEAVRCARVGFMRNGKILLEGKPDHLRAALQGRILEVYGDPLHLLRELTGNDQNVEDVQMFGDRLHLRVRPGSLKVVIKNLRKVIPASGGRLVSLRPITPQLEDIFINLLETKTDAVTTVVNGS
jgi:ABC-2 type transport system ATP-binding protein